jgi:class 3 adenylate cyclase/pimeloyl-ACP methyl ester carboxylesterase
MEPQIQYAKTTDGVDIAYWVVGQGPAVVNLPPLVFSHCQREWQIKEWREWWTPLLEGHRLIRYDARGSGLSERNVSDLSLDKMLLDVDAVAGQVGTERFPVFAPNWAGLLGIAYAATRPERVSRLVLWNSPGSGAREESRTHVLRQIASANWQLFADSVALASFGWEAGPLGRAFAEYIMEATTPEGYQRFSSALAEYEIEGYLSRVDVPTLVIQPRGLGVRDARSLASSLPKARLLIVEGGSAAPFVAGDGPAVMRAILEFLDEEPSTGTAAEGAQRAGLATILFTDLASSTALTQRLGDAKAQELVRTHNQIVREALAAHGGTEIKHTGDGIMASFPTASGAIEAAIAIQRRVSERDVGAHGHSPLQVHIGVNAGEPVAEESDLFGTSVQLARRICDHAEAGQILVSNVVRELAAGKGFLFADVGEVVPKGFDEAVRLYEVRWRE